MLAEQGFESVTTVIGLEGDQTFFVKKAEPMGKNPDVTRDLRGSANGRKLALVGMKGTRVVTIPQ